MVDKPYLFANDAPGRRARVIALAREAEARGFPGVFSESPGDNLALSLAVLDRTERITVGTGIAGIYLRHSHTIATGASLIEELHPGRFLLGVGVSHVPFHEEMGISYGKPLADMRRYVESIRSVTDGVPCPPIIVAALRKKMTALAGQIADGVMWANAALSHLPFSLAQIAPERRASMMIISNSAPTCVSEDRRAALEAIRRYLLFYVKLPNYQNYFAEAGYEGEMATIRSAIEGGNDERIMAAIPERLAADVALFGAPSEVRERAEAWAEAGITHLVLDTVSAVGHPLGAPYEVIAAFD
ncbi:MAG: LLM class flavin-dependent oxidoreductase [Rubrobacter sp.]|jgi:probable F420-dependent oxidoreductase|nr:LLM class flavin-dependent oxidoreductase [Rubrobacter sp.]